jgi:hypothetical protein
MDKFSQLIIEAYRNQNFRFAEDPETAPEPEIVAPPALDYSGLFTKLQSLDDTKKIKVFTNLKRAATKLKLIYNIDSQLPIKLDSTKSPAEYSDNSNSNTDENIQTYFYRVFEYLVNYFENESSSAPTSESTTETSTSPSSSSEKLEFKRTKLLISIETQGQPAKSYIVEQSLPIGQMPSGGEGIQINDKGAANSQIYLLKDFLGAWTVSKVTESVTLLNNTELGDERKKLEEGDVISFSETTIIINKIEEISDDELSFPNPTGGGASSAGSTPSESTTESVEPHPFSVDGPTAEISSNPTPSASPSNSKPKITLEVSGAEYTEPRIFNFDSEIMIGRENVSDIILPQATVDPGHANIIPLNGKWYLRDFNSTNGTYLNGIKYKNNDPIELNSEDKITITNYNIKVLSLGT